MAQISAGELTSILLILGALLGGLLLLRVVFHLTAAILRVGCLAVVVLATILLLVALFN